tara:strand:+ start:1226 stop:1453 length:228 start_codon:yes stop_codon:yes gene_type:complete
MVFSKGIAKNKFNAKKYCIDNEIVLDKILYILSRLLKIQTSKKIFVTLRFTIHGVCRGVDCFLLWKNNFMTWPIQ